MDEIVQFEAEGPLLIKNYSTILVRESNFGVFLLWALIKSVPLHENNVYYLCIITGVSQNRLYPTMCLRILSMKLEP